MVRETKGKFYIQFLAPFFIILLSRGESSEVRSGLFRIKTAVRVTDSVISATTAPSFIVCASKCVNMAECSSYNFNMDSGVCELSSKMVDFENIAAYPADAVWKAGAVKDCTKKIPYPLDPCTSSPCLNNGFCSSTGCNRGFICSCSPGWTGDACDEVSGKDCAELYLNGQTTDGIYTISPIDGGSSVQVVCDMTTAGGGWTVFQRRYDGSVHFNTTIDDYRNGFGDLNTEFWLGNNNLHRLTNQADQELYIHMECFNGSVGWALYDFFKVDDQSNWYNLTLGLYSNGTADDSLSTHNYAPFTNTDLSYPAALFPCNLYYGGGWWYPTGSGCLTANLNGWYRPSPGTHDDAGKGINWETFTGYKYSLKATKMMIRPKDFN
ncbi:ficolin-2 [Lingula anatina]|uniref:Ficolin-2 n=1 Tax=Lingula anatina TaxID=7574 RepID=A0A1S3J1T8_LINAN|nr:ficolin-2 [Lingula anatina]|eukprot:XP_013403789.1 ficolin-2 [Lingula anatina]